MACGGIGMHGDHVVPPAITVYAKGQDHVQIWLERYVTGTRLKCSCAIGRIVVRIVPHIVTCRIVCIFYHVIILF
jgi:hypothetical protein